MIEADQIGQRLLIDLSTKDLSNWRDRAIRDGYAPSTVVRRLNLISTVINHAGREWSIHLPMNPAESKSTARPKGADRKRERRLAPARIIDGQEVPAEEVTVMVAVKSSTHAAFLVPLTRLAIETAARQGELCSLTWDDVDLDRRVMIVRGLSGEGSQNGKIRQVPLSTAAAEAVRSLPSANRRAAAEKLFTVDQNLLKVGFARAIRRAGIEDLTFHDLRHEATSRLAKVYTNPLELMRVTGHKTMSMLARYYHADAEELAKRLA